MSYQRCLRCGTCEVTAPYCSFCLWRAYELIDHVHPRRSGCPLGPVFNPGPAKARGPARLAKALAAHRAWLETGIPDSARPYLLTTRLHPRNGSR